MRWPAGVIAQVCLGAGFNRDTAPTAVAVALAASGGDDGFRFGPTVAGGPAFSGAWAIPVDQDENGSHSGSRSLREQARHVRDLTGPRQDDWSWSVVWRQGGHERFMASARAAVDSPTRGIQPPPPRAVTSLVGGTAAIDDAERGAYAYIDGVARWRPRNPITGA